MDRGHCPEWPIEVDFPFPKTGSAASSPEQPGKQSLPGTGTLHPTSAVVDNELDAALACELMPHGLGFPARRIVSELPTVLLAHEPVALSAHEDVDRIPSALHQPLNVHAELPDWILDLVPPAGDHRRVMPGISRRESLKGTSAARVPSFGPAPTSFHPHFSQSITIRHGCETASFRTSVRRHIYCHR